MLESNETLEDKNEPLEKPKRERTKAQQEATEKMIRRRKEAVEAKKELVAPLVQQIETIKKTKGKDVVKPKAEVKPQVTTTPVKSKLKTVVEPKVALLEESDEEEEEVIVIKKKPKVPKKKKVIYVEDDTDGEEETPVPNAKPIVQRMKPEIIKAINPYTIRFV